MRITSRVLLGTLVLSLGACDRAPEPVGYIVDERPTAEANGAVAPRRVERPTPVPTPPRPTPPPRPSAIPAPDNVSAPPAAASRTASGLASMVLEAGSGDTHPGPRDRVTVQYTGWRAEDGQMFDSSVTRGRPASFGVDGVIAGWTEGLQLMVQGEKRRFWIPANLAYEGGRGPQGMLVFDVELLSFVAAPEPPQVPENVSAPPANAERSESGLAWIVLEAGEGTRHPAPSDSVEVHYSGWRAEDGEMFDSSVTRGRPATFRVTQVIPGWTEGLQLMVEGERRRFWIPGNLAYDGRGRGPQGMLVFDVELLSIP